MGDLLSFFGDLFSFWEIYFSVLGSIPQRDSKLRVLGEMGTLLLQQNVNYHDSTDYLKEVPLIHHQFCIAGQHPSLIILEENATGTTEGE